MEKMLIQATPGSTRHHRGSCKRLRLYRLPEASYVTGALWLVDGGITAKELSVLKPVLVPLRTKGRITPEHSQAGLENKETKTIK